MSRHARTHAQSLSPPPVEPEGSIILIPKPTTEHEPGQVTTTSLPQSSMNPLFLGVHFNPLPAPSTEVSKCYS